MKDEKWTGELGSLLKKHLELRESVGRVIGADKHVLCDFNNFLSKNYPDLKTVTRMAVQDFLREKSHLQLSTKKTVVIYIRQFAKFLNQRGISAYVPDKSLMPKYKYRPRYYPIDENLVREIMKELERIRPWQAFVGKTYSTIVALLWCTGMRRREIVNLDHGDIDFDRQLLLIRQTKFHKDRLIPLSKSVFRALEEYTELKVAQGYAVRKKDALFINYGGKRVVGHSISTALKRAVRRLKLKEIEGRLPALHDFRHNFATQTMEKIFLDPESLPPGSYMPRLSTYLGHTDIFTTQWYLHPDFNLMQKASKKFKRGKE